MVEDARRPKTPRCCLNAACKGWNGPPLGTCFVKAGGAHADSFRVRIHEGDKVVASKSYYFRSDGLGKSTTFKSEQAAFEAVWEDYKGRKGPWVDMLRIYEAQQCPYSPFSRSP